MAQALKEGLIKSRSYQAPYPTEWSKVLNAESFISLKKSLIAIDNYKT